MLNLSRLRRHDSTYHSELEAPASILNPLPKQKLPRHIAALESPAHKINSNRQQATRQYSLSSDRRAIQATNLAVNILRYQLEYDSRQKHLKNLYCSLKHRLAVAQRVNNEKLIRMLEQELEQIEEDYAATRK